MTKREKQRWRARAVRRLIEKVERAVFDMADPLILDGDYVWIEFGKQLTRDLKAALRRVRCCI